MESSESTVGQNRIIMETQSDTTIQCSTQWRGPGPITEEYCGHVTGYPPIRMLPRAVPHCNGDTVPSQPHNLAYIHAIKCSVQLQLCQLDKNNL